MRRKPFTMPTLQGQKHRDTASAPQGQKRRASSSSNEAVHPPYKKRKASSSSNKTVNPPSEEQKKPSSPSNKTVNPPSQEQKKVSSSSNKTVNPPSEEQKKPSSPSNKTVNPPSEERKAPPKRPRPNFWDDLPEIRLWVRALQELDRRNGHRSRNSTQTSRIRHLPSNLCRLAKQGGPDLSYIRGYRLYPVHHQRTMTSHQDKPRREEEARSGPITMTSNRFDEPFETHFLAHNIYPSHGKFPNGTYPLAPNNKEWILQALAQPIQLEFNNDDFDRLQEIIQTTYSKEGVIKHIKPLLEGTTSNHQYVASNTTFSNLDFLTDCTLSPARPDFFYGATRNQFHSQVYDELRHKISPSKFACPLAPNFFFGVKSLKSTFLQSNRQACYYGAIGAKAIQNLQFYRRSLEHDYNAYTMTVVFEGGGILKVYATYAIPLKTLNTGSGFVSKQIAMYSLGKDFADFCQGITAFRNAKEWTRSQRDYFIEQANGRAQESIATGSAGPNQE